MVACTMLAVLDNNSKTKLEQAKGENGKSSWKLHWSKHSQTFMVKKQCVPKDYLQRFNAVVPNLFEPVDH